MAVEDIIYDNWGNVTVTDILYHDIPVRYELETTDGVFVIEEPIGWDAVPFTHKRDRDRHGFNYEITGGEFNLNFDTASGKEEIAAEYQTFGNDGNVLFRRILEYDGGDIIEYEGRLNLNVLKRKDFRYECVVERKSLHELIKSRWDSMVNLDSPKTLDGEPTTADFPGLIILPGQMISEKYESEKTLVRQEAYTETRTGDEFAYLTFDFNDPSVNTIKDFFGNQLGVSGDPHAVTSGDLAIFEFKADGEYHVKVTVDFECYVRINPRFLGFNKEIDDAWIRTQINVLHTDGTLTDYDIHYVPPWNPDKQGVQYPRVTATVEHDIPILAGDKLMIAAHVQYGHNAKKLKNAIVTVKQFRAGLWISGYSAAAPSFSGAQLVKEQMIKILERITGKTGILKTDFYSPADEDHATDGCGSLRLLTNGGRLRNAPPEQIPMTMSLKDILASLNAIDCVGMGYEWDAENKKELVCVEPVDYFYRDVEVFEITEVSDYVEETAKDLIYNKISVGYEKFKEEDENSFDEIHAAHQYQTPIKSEANEYSIVSKYVASGYLIEVARRLFFEENKKEAGPYDDNIFFIHVDWPDRDTQLYFPVTDAPFSQVENVVEPTKTLNMTITPKRMLMAHSKWLMSSLIYKDASQLLINNFTKQNKDFTSTLDPAYSCPRGDDARVPLRAADDVVLGVFGDFTGVYSPEWVNFKARMTMSQIRYIINAHRGLSPDNNNYGYITFPDDNGVVRKGWLHEMSYDRRSMQVSFKLLKKKFP